MEAASTIGSSKFVECPLIENTSRVILYSPQIFYNKSNESVEKTRDEAVFDVAPFSMLGCVSDGRKPRSLLCGRRCAPEGDNGALKERE